MTVKGISSTLENHRRRFHHLLDGGLLHRQIPGGILVAFQTGGVIHALAFAGDDAGGVVLNDGGHGGNGQGIVTDQGRGDGVLEKTPNWALPEPTRTSAPSSGGWTTSTFRPASAK